MKLGSVESQGIWPTFPLALVDPSILEAIRLNGSPRGFGQLLPQVPIDPEILKEIRLSQVPWDMAYFPLRFC